jgi:hypothetical protein
VTRVVLSRHSDAPPLTSVYLTHANRGDSGGLMAAGIHLGAYMLPLALMMLSAGIVKKEGVVTLGALTFACGWFPLLYVVRDIALGTRRKWRMHGHRANEEWLTWLEQAWGVQPTDRLPLLSNRTLSQGCLVANLPKNGRSNQYEFTVSSHAAGFIDRHRELIVQRLRASSPDHRGERRLAIGILETNQGDALLMFRQFSDECALFVAVTHQRNGTVVNLITQRWALFNRDASPEEGRKRSDEQIAAKLGLPDQEKWRARPEWGALGYWHLVDYICHSVVGNAENPTPRTSASDSELDYYEKIVHVETVKEAHQLPTPTQPPAQTTTPADVRKDFL